MSVKELFHLDHTKEFLPEAMGISKFRAVKLFNLTFKLSLRYTLSQVIQKIMNSTKLSTLDKMFVMYTYGGIMAVTNPDPTPRLAVGVPIIHRFDRRTGSDRRIVDRRKN